MIDAMTIGLSGMRAAETAVSARALNIVNQRTPGYRPVEPVSTATEKGVRTVVRERPLVPGAIALAEGAPSDFSLAEEFVQMRLAEVAYKASAAIVRTASRMSETALEIAEK